MPDVYTQFLTIAEAGRYLRISRQAAWKAARRGNFGPLHFQQIGRWQVFVRRSELVARYGEERKAG